MRSALDPNKYAAGLKVSDAYVETLNLRRATFHGEWNYSLLPRSSPLSVNRPRGARPEIAVRAARDGALLKRPGRHHLGDSFGRIAAEFR